MKGISFDRKVFESERWISFLESTARGLGLNYVFISRDTGVHFHRSVKCPLCSESYEGLNEAELREASDKYEGKQLEFSTGRGNTVIATPLGTNFYVVAADCHCSSTNRNVTPLKQRVDIANRLLSSFYLALNEGFEGGRKTIELSTLRKINYNILSVFKGDDEAVTRAFDIILSSLVILLEAKSSWIRFDDGAEPTLLLKGDGEAVKEYFEGIDHPAIDVGVHNSNTSARLGVLGAQDTGQAEYFLPLMAQECTLVFEIDRLFKLFQRKTSQILGSIGSGILLLDDHQTVSYANNAVHKIFEDMHIGLVGKHISEIDGPWPPFTGSGHMDEVSGHMDSIGKPPGQKMVDWQVCRLEEDNITKGWVIVIDDRTDYYRWQEAIRQAERLETTAMMVGSLAHEMRNPLSAARGLLQLMSIRHEPEKVKDYADLVLREIDRVTRLLSDFLLLGKPAQMSSRPVDVQNLLHKLLPMLSGEASCIDVEVVLDTQAVPPILADQGQLTQMIMNVVRNAVEAAQERGRVLITLGRDNDEIVLKVKDDGQGISQEVINKLFHPFYTTKKNGTGLGLPVVRAIVQNHGGHIKAANAAEGGAEFTIRLPIITENLKDNYGVNVIIATGDWLVRYPLERAFRTIGLSTVSVNSVREAVSSEGYCCPDVIICEAEEARDCVEMVSREWSDTAIVIIGDDNNSISGGQIYHCPKTDDFTGLMYNVQKILRKKHM